MDLFERAAQLRRERARAALVTVIETQGSTPRKPGARMIVHADGQLEGTIGGGRVEVEVVQVAKQCIETGNSSVCQFALTHELAMCCGGQMRFFVEPLMPKPVVIVFGCGHVGAAIVDLVCTLDFDVVAVDDLDTNANEQRFPGATQIVNSYAMADLAKLPFGPNTYVVVVTREHSLDQRILELAATKTWAYLGAIGSKRKAALQVQRLQAKGIADDIIERIHCPMGLPIGAVTPEEIAVSVCGELVRTFRQRNDKS